jgi:hypothetical protein
MELVVGSVGVKGSTVYESIYITLAKQVGCLIAWIYGDLHGLK